MFPSRHSSGFVYGSHLRASLGPASECKVHLCVQSRRLPRPRKCRRRSPCSDPLQGRRRQGGRVYWWSRNRRRHHSPRRLLLLSQRKSQSLRYMYFSGLGTACNPPRQLADGAEAHHHHAPRVGRPCGMDQICRREVPPPGVTHRLESAHLVPAAENTWFEQHAFHVTDPRHGSIGLDGVTNRITVRADLNKSSFDEGDWVLFPYEQQWVCWFVKDRSNDLAYHAHGRVVDLPDRVNHHYLHTRFSWNLFRRVFLSKRIPFKLAMTTQTLPATPTPPTSQTTTQAHRRLCQKPHCGSSSLTTSTLPSLSELYGICGRTFQ
ncbi:hypothetical protein B0H16DRAFT_81070 [Mycena metata]|uniref:HNH nuclease domain-containing protein n=1 Tax=Mycena metata TaxID=1033252 RepID=A0AAD7JZ36_9AGAR|nr:hypothetical protein B0H16DRAFT_81070 [Mycena metata]